jgi:hypothetical protein
MEVVTVVMRDIRMYCAVDRIFLADSQATSRIHTRAVVVYMRTPFHKREAMIKLKKFLAHWQVQDATVRDCFPTDVMERARHLASYGAHLRRTEDSVRRYQVVNRRGEPVLQVAGSNGRYVDHAVDEVALKALIAGQADNRPQREADRGKTGPRHTAKNKKRNTTKKSSGRSSPMATDDDSSTNPAIQTGSVNAVPQSQVRTTINLTSASLNRRDRSTDSEQYRGPPRMANPPVSTAERSQLPRQPLHPLQRPPMQQQRPPQQVEPLQPQQPQQQRQDGRLPAVPQPGSGPRQVAPVSGMAETAPYGQQWYPTTPLQQGPIYQHSEYPPSVQGGPQYMPYEAQPMRHAGHPGYMVGHYGPAPIRFSTGQQQPAGYFRNGDSDL